MSEQRYIISFYDKTAKVVGQSEAGKIMQFIEEGRSHFRIKGELYACAGVAKVLKMKTVEQNVDDGSYQRALNAPSNPVKQKTISAVNKEVKKILKQ